VGGVALLKPTGQCEKWPEMLCHFHKLKSKPSHWVEMFNSKYQHNCKLNKPIYSTNHEEEKQLFSLVQRNPGAIVLNGLKDYKWLRTLLQLLIAAPWSMTNKNAHDKEKEKYFKKSTIKHICHILRTALFGLMCHVVLKKFSIIFKNNWRVQMQKPLNAIWNFLL